MAPYAASLDHESMWGNPFLISVRTDSWHEQKISIPHYLLLWLAGVGHVLRDVTIPDTKAMFAVGISFTQGFSADGSSADTMVVI